jgi:hypothetical protein
MAKRRPTIHVPTENADAIARVTSIVSAEEKASIALLSERLSREMGIPRFTESMFVRRLIRREMESALKNKDITEKQIEAKAKEVRAGITLRKAQP